jgi:hypothetical protein
VKTPALVSASNPAKRLRRKIGREVGSFEERAEREYKKGKLATFGQGVVG